MRSFVFGYLTFWPSYERNDSDHMLTSYPDSKKESRGLGRKVVKSPGAGLIFLLIISLEVVPHLSTLLLVLVLIFNLTLSKR